MKTVTETVVRKKSVLLVVMLLSVLLAAWGSVALAAENGDAKSTVQLTIYDPFRCVRTPVASDVSIGVTVESTAVSVAARPVIRVPVRAPLRSAFHPVY
jgi:hypothetical protein